jgi:uncharacterized protein (UPF0264 family)
VIVAQLLVSVRSVNEALTAFRGGAAIIDVKEPDRGPLGCADAETWSAVRRALPRSIPVSVALGELCEWTRRKPPGPEHLAGVAFRKLGLAGAGSHWSSDWTRLRGAWRAGPKWVAVAYADWQEASAPSPDEVLSAALEANDCDGILLDTWDKSRGLRIDLSSAGWVERAREGGLLTAIAGGLDERSIASLRCLNPDVFAARAAACQGGDRRGPIDACRVARLVQAVS